MSVEQDVDPSKVTAKEVWDVYDDDHPDPELAGKKFLVLPEAKGVVTFTVTLEASGFKRGDRVQLDVGCGGGYRAFEVVEPPTGDEPTTFVWKVGSGPIDQAGAPVFIAFEAGKRGAVGAQLARLDA